MQCRSNAVNRDARGAGVPDRERTDFVGVHVFGRLYELGKAGQRVASVDVSWCRDVHEHGEVALHYKRVVVHVRGTLRARFEPITFRARRLIPFAPLPVCKSVSDPSVCEHASVVPLNVRLR